MSYLLMKANALPAPALSGGRLQAGSQVELDALLPSPYPLSGALPHAGHKSAGMISHKGMMSRGELWPPLSFGHLP